MNIILISVAGDVGIPQTNLTDQRGCGVGVDAGLYGFIFFG